MPEPTLHRQKLLKELFANQWAMARVLMAKRAHYIQTYGLNRAQAEALFACKYQDCRTIGQLAQALGVTSGAATQTVETLEQSGLVERQREQQDRRVVELSFTPKGEQLLVHLSEAHFARMANMLSVLSDDELDQLASLQAKIITNLPEDPA